VRDDGDRITAAIKIFVARYNSHSAKLPVDTVLVDFYPAGPGATIVNKITIRGGNMHQPATTTLLGVICAVLLLSFHVAFAANGSGLNGLANQLSKDSNVTDITNAEIDLEYDAAKCAAYYTLNDAIAKQSGYANTATGKNMDRASADAMQLFYILAKGINMSQSALESQFKMDIRDISKQFGKNYVNAPTVVESVGLPCKALIEHPTERLAYWLDVEHKQDARAHKH